MERWYPGTSTSSCWRTQDAASLRDLVLNTFQAMLDLLSTQDVLILDELSGLGEADPSG